MTPSTPYSSGEGWLLPCPFCGGPARDCFNGDVPFPMYWVLCEKCHSSPGDRSSREEAAAAWNTRVVSPGLPVGEGGLGSSLRDTHRAPDGWVLVPIEPSEAMVQRACDVTFGPVLSTPEEYHRTGYRAMIEAAQQEQANDRR